MCFPCLVVCLIHWGRNLKTQIQGRNNFRDHASSVIFLVNQTSLRGGRLAQTCGHKIKSFRADRERLFWQKLPLNVWLRRAAVKSNPLVWITCLFIQSLRPSHHQESKTVTVSCWSSPSEWGSRTSYSDGRTMGKINAVTPDTVAISVGTSSLFVESLTP
jgi:hypothetical protein